MPHPSRPRRTPTRHDDRALRLARSAALAAILLAAVAPARACTDGDETAIFACDAAGGRKFIELCAPTPVRTDGYLVYRFGRKGKSSDDDKVEFEYPKDTKGAYARFRGAVYKDKAGVYTQEVRFDNGGYRYRVFTTSGRNDNGAGVEVRDLKSGKTTAIDCSEQPRFYIDDLKAVIACDDDTPVGTACIDAKLSPRR